MNARKIRNGLAADANDAAAKSNDRDDGVYSCVAFFAYVAFVAFVALRGNEA